MEINKNQINDTQVEIEIKLNSEDIQPYLEHSAKHLSAQKPIPGFRPGKATFDVAKRHFGEDAIFKEALDDIVNGSINQAIAQENLKIFAEGDFKLLSSALGQVHYKITFTLLPEVKLGEWQSKKISKKEVTVSEEETEKAATEIARMLVQETEVQRDAKKDDKVVLDFDVVVDGKVIEGGVGRSYPIIIGENKMIPGFEDQVIGHKASDEFSFKLNFPKDYAPHLAGKEAEFKIKVHSVMERTFPAVDDELAKKIGETDKNSLLLRLKDNLKHEKEDQEMQKSEIEAVKAVIDSATIGSIPEKAIEAETDKLIAEMEHDLSHQGMSLESYLKASNKKMEDVKTELKPKGLERVKTSLVLSQMINENNITLTEAEVEQEISKQKLYYQKNPQALKDIETPQYKQHLANRMLNRKAIKFITDKLLS